VFVREDVPPGEAAVRASVCRIGWHPSGVTSGALARRTRETRPLLGACRLRVFTPIVISPPTLNSAGDQRVLSTVRQKFVLGNSSRSGPVGAWAM